MAHLGPTIGGSKYPHRCSPPHPAERSASRSVVRLPWDAVRPPAMPNRPLSAVYSSDDAVSQPAAESSGSRPGRAVSRG
jgi:hypothetical protein